MNIDFYKFQGTGNDFIMIDNRKGEIHLSADQIQELCTRRFNVGADGIIFLSNKEGYDFEMDYYNPDGSQTFCGNGGRCSVAFAKVLGIRKDKYYFLGNDGPHEGAIANNGWVTLKMKDVNDVAKFQQDTILNTGVPHYVKIVKNLNDIDVYTKGKEIRMSPDFIRDGINVNFVEVLDDDSISVRTYERGVEDETFSCGTGVTASALVVAHNDRGFNRVEVETKGGHLAVEYDKVGDAKFENIWLCGPATLVFRGQLNLDVQPATTPAE